MYLFSQLFFIQSFIYVTMAMEYLFYTLGYHPVLLYMFVCSNCFSFGSGPVAQLFGALPCTRKGYRFNSQSGHILRLWVQPPFVVHMGGNQSVFLSQINVSSSFFFSPHLPLSLKSINISLGEDLKKLF